MAIQHEPQQANGHKDDKGTKSQQAGRPVIIIGAGISGLLLAQHLKARSIPFRIFERDPDMTTRGIGWGLTLHWSLPALRELLPPALIKRVPEAYVDRRAVEVEKAASRFPFYDLSTGEQMAATPTAPETERVRVARQRFREVLVEGIDVEWNKGCKDFSAPGNGAVTANFTDGTSTTGSLLVACDGGNSPIRNRLFPDLTPHAVPVKLMGLQFRCSPEHIAAMRKMDPFFLQGAASENDSFMYFSILDAPQNTPETTTYNCQLVLSWPIRPGFFGQDLPLDVPRTNPERMALARKMAATWAEPFRSFVTSIPEETEFKSLGLTDWAPPKEFRGKGRVALVGDSFHAMTMYRGEGANHAIVDVHDFVESVVPLLEAGASTEELRAGLDKYEDMVVKRARPGVLASRRACLDAHEWGKIGKTSPLLSKRAMFSDFDEE